MLDFKYNKHQQQEAEELAKHYNMKFELHPTFRNAIQYNHADLRLSPRKYFPDAFTGLILSPTIVLSASGYLKPCNYYASFNHFTDLTDWAEANGFDWENDLNVKNGIEHVYNSQTWKELQKNLAGDQENLPQTCKDECSKRFIQNDP